MRIGWRKPAPRLHRLRDSDTDNSVNPACLLGCLADELDKHRQATYLGDETMSTEIAKLPTNAELIEKVIVGGDLSKMSAAERVSYYNFVCESAGLNPWTQPFDYLVLNGKMRLYALKSCTDQLRKINHVSVSSIEAKFQGDIYIVTCQVRDSQGRTDTSTGAICVGKLQGEALANALMKAETKAKRRATLSICGLSLLDESEVETIPGARTQDSAQVDKPVVITQKPTEKPAETPSQFITQAQYLDLRTEAEGYGCLISRILKACNVETPRQILAAHYDSIRNRIRNRDAAFMPPASASPLATEDQQNQLNAELLRTGTEEDDFRALQSRHNVADIDKVTSAQATAMLDELLKLPSAAPVGAGDEIAF